ncbi:MAG TPA: cupredoxin domain-containing protein [Candidatus Binataceae bacterium]|nr:cupredoxin domain-containing protein [Candidatus Binataceae bacterium]
MPRRSAIAKTLALAIGTTAAIAFALPVLADNATMTEVRFQHGVFEPSQVTVDANKPFKVKVTNSGAAAIEFESFELHRERVVPPGETITVFMPSLSPGSYQFFDDFHHEVPKGVIVSK